MEFFREKKSFRSTKIIRRLKLLVTLCVCIERIQVVQNRMTVSQKITSLRSEQCLYFECPIDVLLVCIFSSLLK